MKKSIITLLALSFIYTNSIGQVMQKRMTQTNTHVTTVPIVKQPNPANPAATSKKTTIEKAESNVVRNKSIVYLNTRNTEYRQKILSPALAKLNASRINQLFVYKKSISFPDKSKLNVRLIKNPSFALQAGKVVTPKIISSNSTSNDKEDCVTEVVSLSATSTDFLNNHYSAQTAHIYPGAIYTYDHLYDGSFKEEGQNRNPIIIGSDNPNMNGNTYEEVSNPAMFTVQNAVAKLYQRFVGPSANESLAYQISESSNTADFSLKMGAGAGGYGFSAYGSMSMQTQQQHYYLTIDVLKTLFTISCSQPDSGYFNKPTSSSSPYVIMGNVSYGMRILANLDFTVNSKQDEDSLRAAYSGYGIKANFDMDLLTKNVSLNSAINAYIIGGPSSGTTVAFTKEDLKSQIQSLLTQLTYTNAKPVSYQLYDMDGSVIGDMSATDQFSTPQCIPSDLSKGLQPVFVNMVTGSSSGDNKDGDTHYSLGFFDQDGKQIAVFHDDSNTDEYAEGSSSTIKMADYTSGPVSSSSWANFTGKGGRVHLNVAPNGHDTWKLNTFTLNLTFDNDLHSPHKITWSNITMSQNARDHDFYFDKSFNPL